MEWYADREVTSKEREAIDEALSTFNYNLSDDDIQRWINDDTISLNTCRNGRDVVWILLEDNNEVCVYVDNLKKLTNEEIKNQLL
jgi:hypothetical protein